MALHRAAPGIAAAAVESYANACAAEQTRKERRERAGLALNVISAAIGLLALVVAVVVGQSNLLARTPARNAEHCRPVKVRPGPPRS